MKHQVHASNLVETPEDLLCAFFRGTHEGENDVGIYLARNLSGDWVMDDATRIADGKGKPCWNPVLFQVKQGQLLLFYTAGEFQAWTAFMKRSTDHGKTWSEAEPLPDGFLGPIRNKPVLLPDGRLLCPSSTEVPDWRIHFELYDDADGSWQKIEVSDHGGFDAIQPTLLVWPDHIQALCRTCNGVIVTCRSTDGGWTWTPLTDSGLPNPNSAIDAVMLRDGRAILVYNHAGLYERQRRLRSMKPCGPRTPLNVAISEDGKSWRQIATLEDDERLNAFGRPPEFSYPSVIQTADGKVHVTYTWRRQRIAHWIIEVPDVSDAAR